MKHKIKILIVIAIYLLIMNIGANVFAPSGKISLNVITRDDSGNIYGVDSSYYYLNVYKFDSEGNSEDVYTCKNDNGKVESMIRYRDGILYLGQLWYSGGDQYFSVWEKSDSDKGFTKLWEYELEDEVNITDMYVKDGIVYVMGVEWANCNVAVYSYDGVDEQNFTIACDFALVSAVWGNDGIYLLTQDNMVYYSDLDGNKTKVDIDNTVMIMTDEQGIYYSQIDSDRLKYRFYTGYGGYTYGDLGDIWNIASSNVAQNLAIMSYVDGGDRLMITDLDGSEVLSYIDTFRLGLWKRVCKCFLPLLILTLIYAILVILVYLFKKLVWNSSKLRYQTMAVVSSVCVIWLVAMLVAIYARENANEYADLLEYSLMCSQIQMARIDDEVDIKDFDYDNYIGSSQQEAISKLLGNDELGSVWQYFFTSQEIIYGYDNPKFVYSNYAAYGSYVDTVYNTSTLEYIRQCMDENTTIMTLDEVAQRNYAMVVTPIGKSSQQLCMLTKIPIYIGTSAHVSMKTLYIVSVIGWMAVMLLLRFFLKNRWDFTNVIVSRMERVSRGDYKSEDRTVPDNEFGKMWTSLERMCKNVRFQKYKQDNTLEYVNQFAPKNFERLFGKDNLLDIEVGEVVRISATMGVISIVDRDTLESGKIQRQYMLYVNQLMEILFSQEQSKNAIFLQNGSNLETVKVVFGESDNNALTATLYSVDCLENLQGLATEKYDTKPFILLHTSTFSCGIAGGSRQLYPYVTSIEMETLSSYIEALKSCNVSMVVTKSTWQEIHANVTGRYIGYVVGRDRSTQYGLYEILDACSQTQKLGRLKNIENFDSALKHYYNNDLYTARNMFSEIVKECPDDGIARWYAFSCDELYNRADKTDTDIHYELFWTMF